MLEAQNLAARRGFAELFKDLGFRVKSGDALVVTGRTARARRRCCACSRACRPGGGRDPLARTPGRAVLGRASRGRRLCGHLPALKDELTAEKPVSLVELSGTSAPRADIDRRARQRRAVASSVAAVARAVRRTAQAHRPRPAAGLAPPALDPRRAGHRARCRGRCAPRTPGPRSPRSGGIVVAATHQSLGLEPARVQSLLLGETVPA